MDKFYHTSCLTWQDTRANVKQCVIILERENKRERESVIERERSVNMHVMALPPDCAGAAMTRELHFRGRG